MNILIFGGTGYIGENLILDLYEENDITVFSRGYKAPKIKINSNINYIKFDIKNQSELSFSKADVLIYLISTTNPNTSNENIFYDIDTNLISTLNIFVYAAKVGVKKIVFASTSGAVYANPFIGKSNEKSHLKPQSSYGILKLAVESYLELLSNKYNIDYCVLRISNPYGRSQNHRNGTGFISALLESIYSNSTLSIFGDGNVRRDFIHISDLVHAFKKVVYNSTKSKVFNIGSGKSYTMNEIIEMVEKYTNKKVNISAYNKRLCDVDNVDLDIKLAQKELNWNPEISFKTGLEDYINNYTLYNKIL